MGRNKFVHLTFAIGGLLAAFVLSRATDWVWSYFAKPNEILVNALSLVLAGVGVAALYRSERVFGGVVDITEELQRVTWPTRQETQAATVVVLVTVLVSALILSIFDAIWSWFTNWFLR